MIDEFQDINRCSTSLDATPEPQRPKPHGDRRQAPGDLRLPRQLGNRLRRLRPRLRRGPKLEPARNRPPCPSAAVASCANAFVQAESVVSEREGEALKIVGASFPADFIAQEIEAWRAV